MGCLEAVILKLTASPNAAMGDTYDCSQRRAHDVSLSEAWTMNLETIQAECLKIHGSSGEFASMITLRLPLRVLRIVLT